MYEPPCEHLPLFDTCLAKVTIFKSKLCSNLAAAVNMDSESHKIAFVEVLGDSGDCKYKDEETSQLEFVLELNFGLKSMLSSTPYMRCLKCAGFSKEEWNLNMIACYYAFQFELSCFRLKLFANAYCQDCISLLKNTSIF